MELDAFAAVLTTIDVPWLVSMDRYEPLPDDTILLGSSANFPQTLAETVLVLDNKAAGTNSVARLVANLDEDVLAQWPLWSERPLAPKDVLDRVTLVVEDASPDSVWGLIVLLARMTDCDLRPGLAVWLSAVERWEQTGNSDQPESEWTSLAAALAHSKFGPKPHDIDRDYRAAWTAALRFAGECLRRNLDPLAIIGNDDFMLLKDAKVTLRQEEQAYREWLSHAHMLQLSLPIARASARRLLVDALIFIEDDPTGAAKTIYRNDREGSPLGNGFTFAASYRPSAVPGSGADFTITVDPRQGVHLREVWEELERMETEAWLRAGEKRPDWNPRFTRQGSYNQHWYLNDDQTLIGAPRRVRTEPDEALPEIPGSKLSWADIQGTIWRVCNPLRNIVVEAISNAPVSLLELQPEPAIEPGTKIILLARWHVGRLNADAPNPHTLSNAPIVDRLLAALTVHRDPALPLTIGELPRLGSWQRAELAGGFAIVTAAGVFVLDDWREIAHPDLHAVRDVCLRARRLDHELAELEHQQIAPLAAEISNLLSQERLRSEKPRLVVRAARIAVHLAELRSRNALARADPDAQLVQDALDKTWNLDRRLVVMEQQVKAVSDSLKALGDAQMRRITQLVAFVGFPFYLASGLAQPIAKTALAFGAVQGLWPTPAQATIDNPPTKFWWFAFAAVFGFAAAIAAWIRGHDSRGD